jgi:hypothetical protein
VRRLNLRAGLASVVVAGLGLVGVAGAVGTVSAGSVSVAAVSHASVPAVRAVPSPVHAVLTSVTCPTGSVTWHTEDDVNGFQFNSTADNYGTNAKTCFTYGADGQLTVTQADPTDNFDPTSYPSNQYGCSSGECTYGWTNKLWSSTTMTVTGSATTSGDASGTKNDILTDVFLTSATGEFGNPNAEIEIVTAAYPSYTGLGFCAATSCGATEVTIDGSSWWYKTGTTAGGWTDYYFVANTMSNGITGLALEPFMAKANATKSLSTWNLGSAWFGSEFWENGVGFKINSVSATNVP